MKVKKKVTKTTKVVITLDDTEAYILGEILMTLHWGSLDSERPDDGGFGRRGKFAESLYSELRADNDEAPREIDGAELMGAWWK